MPSPARRAAFAVLRRTFEDGAYADRALAAETRRLGLEGRELALATQLSYGAVQRVRTLDHWAAELSGRPVERLDPPVRAALRLGLFQLRVLGGIAPYAAVDESVELAKATAPRGAGLVNAVLRRAAREPPAPLPDDTPERAALAHSVPDWLAVMWWDELGAEEARALLRVVNEPAESAIRINPLAPDPKGTVPFRSDPEIPEARILSGPWDAWGSEEWRAGAIYPQSRASMLVARALDPRPGERVLDLCAAPGGKTTHLAALMGDEGEVVGVERNPKRADGLRRTAARMHATCVTVVEGDAAAFVAERPFDRVLVDPPCSGLGTLQSRPDLRWRTSPERIAELVPVQRAILAAGKAALTPDGTLVYSVCTLSRREEPEERWEWNRRTLPHRDHTEGFFMGRLRGVAQ
jgi:16S rRNA (cytosine967-C5)-methyltransferase